MVMMILLLLVFIERSAGLLMEIFVNTTLILSNINTPSSFVEEHKRQILK